MAKYSSKRSITSDGISCGCMTMVFFFNAILGMWATNEILSWFGKNIHWFWDLIIGLFTAEVSVPAAIVGWILKSLGVF